MHIAAAWLLLNWQTAGLSEQAGRQGRGGKGPQNIFAISTPASAGGAARTGGGEAVVAPVAADKPITEPMRRGISEGNAGADAGLADELAEALADDPSAGGGLSSYEVILRLHIASHARGLRERLQRPGLAILRFRVARDGAVIDARVLDSPGSRVGEMALAALWRSEPLPRVPDELAVPLEVDVPIDFRVRG